MTARWLEGVRVLDLCPPSAGDCGRILASFGADVVCVTSAGPDDDEARCGRLGKRALRIDLEAGSARRDLHALIAEADVLLESCSPGERSRLGLVAAELLARRPALIVTSITPFGTSGPYAAYKADELVVSAMSGVLVTCGDPDRAPVKEPGDAHGYHGAAAAALGTVLAWRHRQRTGLGQHVDLALQEAGVARNTNSLLLYQFDRRLVKRGGPKLKFGRAEIRCVWRLADGFLFFSMATGRFGAPANRALSAWIDELGYDNPMREVDWDRYDRSKLETATREIWEAAIARFFADRTREEVRREARRRGITATVANEPAEVLQHEQLVARDFFERIRWPDAAQGVSVPRYFVRDSATTEPSPQLGTASTRAFTTRADSARPSSPATASTSALAGVRVLDFSWALVGALTTKQLGDFGADIVKVESTTRPCLTRIDLQVARSHPGNWDDKPWFAHLNTSKRSILLDLKNPGARAIVDALVDWADVIVENFSPGTMAKLGLDYASVRARKPAIVMVSGSVYGQTGPMAQEWGIDGTGSALSGRMFLTGWPDREPCLPNVPYGDAVLPLLMAAAVVGAIERRDRTGEGCHIDASMFEAQTQQLLRELVRAQRGEAVVRQGNRVPSAAPHGVFPCRGEDEWIAVAVSKDDEWRALCGVLGLTELAPRHAGPAARKAAEDEIEAALARRTREWDRYELMRKLQEAGVAAGAVQDASDLLERDPQLAHRQFLVEQTHPVLGRFGHQAPPYKLSATPAAVRPAPLLGADTRAVCVDLLGITADEFARLTDAATFR